MGDIIGARFHARQSVAARSSCPPACRCAKVLREVALGAKADGSAPPGACRTAGVAQSDGRHTAQSCPQAARVLPRTLPTPDTDFADATRAYPTDFADKTNN